MDNNLLFVAMLLVGLVLTAGLLYIQIVGIYNSFKAHVGYGIISLFLGPFALAIGAIKIFTGENILLRKKGQS